MLGKSQQATQLMMFAETMLSIETVGSLASSTVTIRNVKIPNFVPKKTLGRKELGEVAVCDQLRSVFSAFQDNLNDNDSCRSK